jgi:hypothetical protein
MTDEQAKEIISIINFYILSEERYCDTRLSFYSSEEDIRRERSIKISQTACFKKAIEIIERVMKNDTKA